MFAPGDAAGGDDGRVLPGAARRDAARRLARSRGAGQAVERPEAVAAAAPRAGMSRAHVVGAGLAGLAAAVALAKAGRRVALYESAEHAGGRCRSYFDAELGVRLDNGNHLLLSGNGSALDYLEMTGALGTFEPPGEAAIPFVDLTSGERWVLRPNR